MTGVSQAMQIAGSLPVLSGFVLSQSGVVQPRAISYLMLNVSGSGALAVDAAIERQWGFLLLEGVWALVSASAWGRCCIAGHGPRPAEFSSPLRSLWTPEAGCQMGCSRSR